MTVKVDFVVNDKSKGNVDLSRLQSVEVRGATGVASYRVDPLQDTIIKIVVVGLPYEKDEDDKKMDDVPVEQTLGTLGSADDLKAAEAAAKEAEKPVRIEGGHAMNEKTGLMEETRPAGEKKEADAKAAHPSATKSGEDLNVKGTVQVEKVK